MKVCLQKREIDAIMILQVVEQLKWINKYVKQYNKKIIN